MRPVRAKVSGAWPPHWPDPTTGSGQSRGENSGSLSASKRADEGIVRLPIFGADAVDLELIDAEQPPELLIDAKVHAEAGMTGQDVPAVAMGVQDEPRTLAQDTQSRRSRSN